MACVTCARVVSDNECGRGSLPGFLRSEARVVAGRRDLEVVGPAGIEAAERAAEQLAMPIKGSVSWSSIGSKPRSKLSNAPRDYKQTDATYVAVRQTLGAEWETALGRVATEQSRLNEFDKRQPILPTPAQREQLARLGEDVRRVWNHPGASSSLKQQVVRMLIVEITADIDEKSHEVLLLIHWSGGHHTEFASRTRTVVAGCLPAN